MSSFKPVVEAFQAALKTDPAQAQATFKVSSQQVAGLRSEVTARDFKITVDEPKELAGTNLGANPAELALAALAACQEITYRLFADALGVPLRGIKVSVEGDIDLRGFFAVDDKVRPGFSAIRASVTFDSDAPTSELERLKQEVDAHCPILDLTRNATPVALSWQRQSKVRVAAE